ncbi:3-hydroxyacyl-ACP dehydratase FabZ family protein [Actinokineospora bangkokensis]|uniref:3-hydroxyacyl-ACP dehydratase n=1 Tax=Actinokineospora bangkokensis TaxID=1193682 RepID=A0A1Q9LNT2_9PSEU|nr:hotdog domain-containing protein [Actinokineospora bangkokensis]OLR93671.1 hypothetical protein BJP25_15505 [Actinokineospora bangkokensis]
MTRAFAAPLTAVDHVERTGLDAVTAVKRITADDPYLGGHYPHLTIYPGVFSVETVYQAARAEVLRDRAGATATLVAVDSVSFRAPLLPGDTLRAECTLSEVEDGRVTVRATCKRSDGQTAAKVRMTLAVREDQP